MANAGTYTTYSFKDLTLVLNDPDGGSFLAFGQIGIGELTVEMSSERSSAQVASDGTVMGSAMPGDNGQFVIQAQQTSIIHQYLLNTYNLKKANYDQGNVANWFGMTVYALNKLDGSFHQGKGVGFTKIPNKPYAAQGQNVTWTLIALDIQNG
jgi:hypothetical protein